MIATATALTGAITTGTTVGAAPPATYHGQVPARVLDTRPGGTTIDGADVGTGRVGADTTRRLLIGGRGGVPASASAVALNVTATAPTSPSFLTVHPAGTARPTASNLNYLPGETRANMVIVPLGTGGSIDLYNFTGSVDLVVDVLGWFPAGAVQGLTPGRLLDTRPGGVTSDGDFEGVGALGPDGGLDLAATGHAGVPATGVDAVVVNITVTNPTAPSYLTAYPAGSTRPTASNLNYLPGETRANMAIVPVGIGGAISLYQFAGTADVVVDVLGWFPTGGTFNGVGPARLADTRSGHPTIDARYDGYGELYDGQVFNIDIDGRGGVPFGADGSVVLNVAATDTEQNGYLTVYPAGEARPTASNLNFSAGQTVPNLVIVPIGTTGQVSIYNPYGATDVIVDVLGWFPNPTDPPTIWGNDLTLRGDGFGALDFGSAPAPVIAAVTALYGAPTVDRTELFPTDSGLGYWVNDDDLAFAYRAARELCWDSYQVCTTFGGDDLASVVFVGMYYGNRDARLFDANGLSVGSRAADFPTAMSYGAGGCYSYGYGTTASGMSLGLGARDAYFSTPGDAGGGPVRPSDEVVYVRSLSAGEGVIALYADC